MTKLGSEEIKILNKLCKESNVDPEFFHVLIQTKREFSYKSSARSNELRKELEKHINFWANKIGDAK